MVNAGLTPFQALRMNPRNADESIHRLDEFGTVAVGKRADFILLDENPLEDIRNIQMTLIGVMVRGMYFSEMQIREMMNRIAHKK